MVSQWVIYGKPLSLHIYSKRLFTSPALFFSSSRLGTIPQTAIIFSFFFKDVLKSINRFSDLTGCSFCFKIVSTYVKYYLLRIYVSNSRLDVVLHTADFAVVNGRTLTIPLCLIFFVRR